MAAGLALLSGINIDDAADIQRSAGVIDPGNIDISGYLIRGRGRTILVDAGTGSGVLETSLRAAGSAPDDVDTVLLTHAHRIISAACWMPTARRAIATPVFICTLWKPSTGRTTPC